MVAAGLMRANAAVPPQFRATLVLTELSSSQIVLTLFGTACGLVISTVAISGLFVRLVQV
jgi:hypothetical protein